MSFKPFDRVLVRSSDESPWRAAIFSHVTRGGQFCTFLGIYAQCICYDGHEYLCDTSAALNSALKPGDLMLVRCTDEEPWKLRVFYDYHPDEQRVFVDNEGQSWVQAMPYCGNESLFATVINKIQE